MFLRFSCRSAIEGGVVAGGSGGLISFSSVFMSSVSDGDLVGFVAKSVGSRKGAFVVSEAGRGFVEDVSEGGVACGSVSASLVGRTWYKFSVIEASVAVFVV